MKLIIGEVLKECRLELHLTSRAVFVFLKANGFTGTEEDISLWESGEVLPELDEFLDLCRLYGIADIPNTFINK